MKYPQKKNIQDLDILPSWEAIRISHLSTSLTLFGVQASVSFKTHPKPSNPPGLIRVGTSVKTYSICDSGVPGFKTTPAIHPIDLIWFKVRCKWMVEVAWGEVGKVSIGGFFRIRALSSREFYRYYK